MFLDLILSGGDEIEEPAQRRPGELTIACSIELLADRIAGGQREQAIERAVGRDDVESLVENDQRLANGIDDAVGVSARGLDMPPRFLRSRGVAEGEEHT